MRSPLLHPAALRSFVAVAEHGSLTAAARVLHYSQSALSLHLKALEDELGVQLLTRCRPRAQLTPAGRRLLAHAEQALVVLTGLEATMRAAVGPGAGRPAAVEDGDVCPASR